MTSSIGQTSGSPWRKRTIEDLNIDIKDIIEAKRPRLYYYRLASESSRTSDDDTESIYSIQEKETDVVRDTSDTESKASDSELSKYNLEFEYEVASLSPSENDNLEISTTDSEVTEDMMLAVAATVMCDSSLEAWITDVEDSDSSSDEASFGRTDFSTCVKCKGENRNPLYRYCEKCFQSCRQCNKHKTYKCFPLCQSCYQDRKKFFPPRPRRNRRKKQEDPVKLDTLRNCLSGLSQDSGIGSSQECPILGLDQIVVPEFLNKAGTSKSEDIPSTLTKLNNTKSENALLNIVKESASTSLSPNAKISSPSTLSNSKSASTSTSSNPKDATIRRKRQSSESSLSEFEIKKPKITPKPEYVTSDLGSEVSSSTSFTSTVSTLASETNGFKSERSLEKTDSFGFYSEKSSGNIALEKNNSFGSDKSESELCMFCNSAPKDSIFLHAKIAHRCCCYSCAKKTLKSIKRCPICNLSVNKVVRIFTS